MQSNQNQGSDQGSDPFAGAEESLPQEPIKVREPMHEDFHKLRSFIYAIVNKKDSPAVEIMVEEIVHCALKGGYKIDIKQFLLSHGAWEAGYTADNDGNYFPMDLG